MRTARNNNAQFALEVLEARLLLSADISPCSAGMPSANSPAALEIVDFNPEEQKSQAAVADSTPIDVFAGLAPEPLFSTQSSSPPDTGGTSAPVAASVEQRHSAAAPWVIGTAPMEGEAAPAGLEEFLGVSTVSTLTETLLSANGPPIESGGVSLPGLYAVDPSVSLLAGQVVFLNFAGGSDLYYRGPILIGPFDIPPFRAPAALSGNEEAIVDRLLVSLNGAFADAGVEFVSDQPQGAIEYSTIFVGGNDAPFAAYGSFLGIAEKVDIGNQDRSDIAFVFSDILAQPSGDVDEYVAALIEIVSHETGRLLGYANANPSEINGPLAALAATYYSNYGYSQVHDITVTPGSHTFEVNGIATYKTTYWFVNRSYVETDTSGWSAWDPDYSYYFSAGTATQIEADVYNSDGSFKEYHVWNVTAQQPAQPDLIVQGIAITPSSPTTGQSVTITATLKNQGTGSASGSILVNYYVDGTYIDYDYLSFGLSAGQSDTETSSYTAALSGNHTIRVVIDPNNSIPESNNANNELSRTYYWNPAPQPDLIVQDIGISPSSPAVGQSVTITATLKNQGTGSASGSILVNYYLDGTYIDNDALSFGLSAGQSDTETSSYTAALSGNHTIRVVIDPNNSIPESDNANNELSRTYYWGAPDLVVDDVWTLPAVVVEGEGFQIMAQIRNQGDAVADAGLLANQEALFFLDGVKYGEGDDYDGLQPGATLIVESVFITGPTPGTHSILVRADGNNEVNEGSTAREGNNDLSETIPVSPAPQPDLIVQDIAIDLSNPAVGQTVTITATLKNQGTGNASGSILLNYYVDGNYIDNDALSFGLSAGQSDTETTSYTASSAGNHTIRVVIDPSGSIPESNNDNNERSEAFYWGAPDLVVDAVWTEPAAVVEGQEFIIKAQIRNQGDATADAGLLANQEVLFFLDSVKYGEGDDYDSLSPGAILVVESISITGPAPGTHTILAKADGNNEVNEGSTAREGNNDRSETISVSPALKPDLVVDDVWTEPAPVVEGQGFIIKAQIRNQGEATADAGLFANQEVLFFIDGVKYGEGDDYDGLAPGATLIVESISITGPAPGTHTILAKADGNNEVDEGSAAREGNNERAESIDVVAPNHAPTLPSQITAPLSDLNRSSARLTWQSSTDPDGDSLEYDVQYGRNNFPGWTSAPRTADTSIVLTGLTENWVYTVRVRAVDSHGAMSDWVELDPAFRATTAPVIKNTDGTVAISPITSQETWVVFPGRGGMLWGGGEPMYDLAMAVDAQVPQVLVVDWSGLAAFDSDGDTNTLLDFGGEQWILPMADWVKTSLESLGFLGALGNLNFIGHSWGAVLEAETLALLGDIDSVIAIDPAEDAPSPAGTDYNTENLNIDFRLHSDFSWAFYSRDGLAGIAGSEATPPRADLSFVVTESEHTRMVSMITNMLTTPFGAVSHYFQLQRVVDGEPGPWKLNQYDDDATRPILETPYYEAVIATTTNGTVASSIRYINVNGIEVTEYDSPLPDDWTVLVYLNGDNDLSDEAAIDINEMETANLANINVVVMVDYVGANNTSRGLILHDSDKTVVSSTLTPMGEADMGQMQTLIDFIQWGTSNYAATSYALVLWNHGGGFTGYGSPPEEMEIFELREAIQMAQADLDLIGFDACLMAQTEVAYELKDLATTFVASESTEPGSGWPYQSILNDLNSSSDMTASELGRTIVADYGSFWEGNLTAGRDTMSSITNSELPVLVSSLEALATTSIASATEAEWSLIRSARNAAAYFEPFQAFRDLREFVQAVASNSSIGTTIRNAAAAVRDALDETVDANWHKLFKAGEGLSIYLPSLGDIIHPEYAVSLSFVASTHWLDFLNYMIGSGPQLPKAPVISGISQDSGQAADGVTNDATVLVRGTAEAGMTITVYQDGTLMGTTTANATGEWTMDHTATTLPDGSYVLTATATDALNNVGPLSAPYSVTIDTAPPTIAGIINDGNPQRSMITSVVLTLSEAATITPDSLSLKGYDGTVIPDMLLNVANPSGDLRTYIITFSGAAIRGGSLPDGVYRLSLPAAAVQDRAGNGLASGFNHVFHRLFGDADGNARVSNTDLFRLRGCLGKTSSEPGFDWCLDYDGNGAISNLDLFQFRNRYGSYYLYP